MPGRSRQTSSIKILPPRDRTRNGRGHLLCLDPRGVAVPCCYHRPVLAKDRWLDRRRSSAPRSALAALRKALTMRRPREGLIHHSDRGSQYCSIDYQAELRRHGTRINCYDNAMVETFFKTLKPELVWRTIFYTRNEAERAVARYIDGNTIP
jgi:hypothetical protein